MAQAPMMCRTGGNRTGGTKCRKRRDMCFARDMPKDAICLRRDMPCGAWGETNELTASRRELRASPRELALRAVNCAARIGTRVRNALVALRPLRGRDVEDAVPYNGGGSRGWLHFCRLTAPANAPLAFAGECRIRACTLKVYKHTPNGCKRGEENEFE